MSQGFLHWTLCWHLLCPLDKRCGRRFCWTIEKDAGTRCVLCSCSWGIKSVWMHKLFNFHTSWIRFKCQRIKVACWADSKDSEDSLPDRVAHWGKAEALVPHGAVQQLQDQLCKELCLRSVPSKSKYNMTSLTGWRHSLNRFPRFWEESWLRHPSISPSSKLYTIRTHRGYQQDFLKMRVYHPASLIFRYLCFWTSN